MKLKTIFHEYKFPKEFWDRLERIFEIETREAYERGLKDKSLIGKNTNSAEKEPNLCKHYWHKGECIVKGCKYSAQNEHSD